MPAPFLPRRAARIVRSRSFALVVALIAAIVMNASARTATETRNQWGATAPVVVAVHEIAAGSLVRAEDLEVRMLPIRIVPDAALSTSAGLIGRAARVDLHALQIMLSDLTDAKPVTKTELLIGNGRVGVSLETAGIRPDLTIGSEVVVVASSDASAQSSALNLSNIEGTVVALQERFVTVAVPLSKAPSLASMVGNGPVLIALKGR